jgi:hypothetical protein
MKINISSKHFQLDKANNYIFAVVAITSIVTVFSLVSVKSLWSQSSYQRKVLSLKKKAITQLNKDSTAIDALKTQYTVFADQTTNIIGGQGGSAPGNGPSDGDNPRIVLDALPSQYDFPALISSIEKILTNDAIAPQTINGTDEGDSESTDATTSTPLNFTIEATSNYSGAQVLLNDFERSIRPVDVTKLELSGSEDSMRISLDGSTYYLPAMKFEVQQKVVK